MNNHEWLKQATAKLSGAGIATARLDALVLLQDELSLDKASILAHPETTLPAEAFARLDAQITRRAGHEPLAYIRGKTEFYGREFNINRHVLEPRPESETMVDLALDTAKRSKQDIKTIADIGTGSGAIAITMKLELPEATAMASDIDNECLKVARQNAKKHHAEIHFFQGNLLEPLLALEPKSSLPAGKWMLLANLPYVPNSYQLNNAAMMEPKTAIYGGDDGLDVYRQLFAQASHSKFYPNYILTEALPFQHGELAKIAKSAGYQVLKTSDFIQLFSFRG